MIRGGGGRFLRGYSVEEDVAREHDAHLELCVEELTQEGWDPVDARREAYRRFGDRVWVAEECRRISRRHQRSARRGFLMDSLMRDFRFALRTLARSPGFSAVAILALAMGIGGSTAMFSVLSATLGRALPFPEPDRLIMGRGEWGGNLNPLAAFPDYMDFRDRAESLVSLAAIGGGSGPVTVTGADEPEEALITDITPNLFETLGVAPILGSTFSIDEQPERGGGQVVISHSFWERWFGGDPEVVGRSLTVEGEPLAVVGVMPAGFRLLFDVDLWTPPWPGHSEPINRRYTNWLLVGRLAEGTSLEAARSEVEVISRQLQQAYPETNRERALRLDDLQSVLVEGARQSLWVLTAAVGMILLIACGNVAGLLMARGTTRTSELALRAALGAGRGRIARQLLAECTVLALLGEAFGVLLAVWFQEAILGFVSLEPLGIQEVGVSPRMLGMGLALSLATVLLFGVFPSLVASRPEPVEGLKHGSRSSSGRKGIRVRSGLVVLQVALSLIVLVGSGLLLRSFAKLRGVDPGFKAENLLTGSVSLPSDDYREAESKVQFFQELKASLEGLPEVESVALINRLPVLQIWGNYPIWIPGQPRDAPTRTADRRSILPGYFKTMGIPLVEGRAVEETDVAGSRPVVVLTRSAAERLYPEESAVGRQVVVDMGSRGPPATVEVVGVVEDHKLSSLSQLSPRSAMFFPYAQLEEDQMRLAVRTRVDPVTLVRPIQERIWEMDRDIVLSKPRTMEKALADSIAGSRSMATVLSLFAAVALGLSALGLYGVLAYFVAQRRAEMGIRIALGAAGRNIFSMVVRRGLLLVGAGSALGIAGAMGATRMVQGLLFGVDATDAVTFAGVTGLFFLIAVGACLLPAWQALRVDPVEAFRRNR